MITNGSVTIFHKGIDETTRLETWTKYDYKDTWFFGGRGAGINKGYDNANDFNCRLPYDSNDNLNIGNFAIGDIVVQGTLPYNFEIETQQDLKDYQVYNITSITDNNFGHNPHIHIGGR